MDEYDRVLMKLFRTSNIDIIKDYIEVHICGIKLSHVQLIQRFDVFTSKLDRTDYLCEFALIAT